MDLHAKFEMIDGRRYIVIRIPVEVDLQRILRKFDLRIATHGDANLFTKREQQVVNMIVEAKSNKEIAAALNLCERTVKFHVSSVLRKSELSTRHEIAKVFRRVA